jgi:phenylalanyl-tRNA synthetase alpha chain
MGVVFKGRFGGKMGDSENLKLIYEKIKTDGLFDLENVTDEKGAVTWKTHHLGSGSALAAEFKNIPKLASDLKPLAGKEINRLKMMFENALNEKIESIKRGNLEKSISTEKLDVTLPGRNPIVGRLHPITQTLRKIISIFGEMGFQVFRSREVETDEFNFELLNIPAYHPARDMWDTFHTTVPNVILRTHTSPGQIHVMRQSAPEPIRVVLPGMCYRYEQMDARHESQMLQVEVLAVGRHITLANLKGTLVEFAKSMYGVNVRSRFRPSYFPFTEPSGDLEIECFICHGKGCNVCRGSGWLEIMGCGMLHPTVLKNGGYDPEMYSGFAAGMGVERVTMLRNTVEEIRYFYGNDLRFLEQF